MESTPLSSLTGILIIRDVGFKPADAISDHVTRFHDAFAGRGKGFRRRTPSRRSHQPLRRRSRGLAGNRVADPLSRLCRKGIGYQ